MNKVILILLIVLIILLVLNTLNIYEFWDENLPIDKVVYVFWTGENKMSENRKKCLESIYKNIGVEVKLITPKNLNNFIKKYYPLHKAYNMLSVVHKSDYLRTYFMHHYGGGYTDVKYTTQNWNQYFDNLNKNKHYIANGYTEIKGGSASYNSKIQKDYKKLIGNCSYIFKKNTKLTQEWINELHKKLDKKYDLLLMNPPLGPRDHINSKEYSDTPSTYPFQWTELLGEHFHDIIYKYKDQLLHDLPLINTQNYL